MGASVGQDKVEWRETDCAGQLARLISCKYKYGFRLGSPIERMRLRNFAEEAGIGLPDSDEALEQAVVNAGTLVDGRIYVFDRDLLSQVGGLLDAAFADGCGVVFLEPFFAIHGDWMAEHCIASVEMLAALLRHSRPNFRFGRNTVTPGTRVSEMQAVTEEIFRVSGDRSILRFEELVRQLPYVPPGKIAGALSASPEIVWVSEGTYFPMSHFRISDEDARAISRFVAGECDRKGYASITDVPMGSIPEDNYQLSVTALHTAIYTAVLKENYRLRGKILTADARGPDIRELLEKFCGGREVCSLGELMERSVELTGAPNRQLAFHVLYDTMVRVGIDRFVSERQVRFDVEEIDGCLERFVGERFVPIRDVTSFALFPPCGQSWNLYLLESYCHRFSRKYRLAVRHYNNKNVGVIIAAALSLSYDEILSQAAAEAEVALTPEAVGRYFFTSGLAARQTYTNLPEIIQRANTIREER